jgi:hypothetical protein
VEKGNQKYPCLILGISPTGEVSGSIILEIRLGLPNVNAFKGPRNK